MIEILEYILGGFWTFVGFISILYVTLFFSVNGLVRIIEVIFNKK